MIYDFQIGLFGYFEFTLRKKVFGHFIETSFYIYGTIKEMDDKNVLIEDSADNDIQYLPAKLKITKFEKQDKPIEL